MLRTVALSLTSSVALAAPAPPRIDIRAEPAHVLLQPGKPADVQVTIRLPEAQAPEIVLHSTAGELSGLSPEGPGRWRAKLIRPAEGFPQLAVITAADVAPVWRGEPPLVGSTVVGYSAALDLAGRTEPGASMRVEIADRGFGPVRADGAGKFLLPIVVPPGENWGRGVSTDSLGNKARSRINLYLPEVRRVHAFLYPGAVVADGSDRAWIFVTTVSAAGGPEDKKLTLSPALGSLEPGERLGVGMWRYPYRAPTSIGPGYDVVKVSVTGIVPDEVRVPLYADRPASLEARAVPSLIPADGTTVGELIVQARDARGNLAGGHVVAARLGDTMLACAPREPGVCAAALPSRERAGSERLELSLLPASPSCPRPRRAAEGLVVDARGVPCSGVSASVTVAQQTVAQPLAGQAHVVWRLPAPVDLRIVVESQSGDTARLRIDATGVDDPAERLVLESEGARIEVLGSRPGVMSARIEGSRSGPMTVVVTDRLTGVSAWARVD